MSAIELRLVVSVLAALVVAIAWAGAISRSTAREELRRARFGTTIPTASAIPAAFRRRRDRGPS